MAAERSDFMAQRIEQRMSELGFTPSSLADTAGVSVEGIRNLRLGLVRRYQPRFTRPVTVALDWTPDSIGRLLVGKEPKPLAGTTLGVVPPLKDVSDDDSAASRLVSRRQLRDHLIHLGQVVEKLASATEELAEQVEELERQSEQGSPADVALADRVEALHGQVDQLLKRADRRNPPRGSTGR